MIYRALSKEYSYSKRDLNPHSRNGQRILSPSCLPFHHSSILSKRAENETRTRDPNLGKVMLYQLSYFRIFSTGAKIKSFVVSAKFFKRKVLKRKTNKVTIQRCVQSHLQLESPYSPHNQLYNNTFTSITDHHCFHISRHLVMIQKKTAPYISCHNINRT